jgi:predicted MFS family arabinose efflux permease
MIVLGLAVFSSASFISQASANSHIGKVVEHSQALAAGMYGSSYYIGGCVGSVVPALLWHIGGWTACVLLIAGVHLLSATVGFVYWTRRRPAGSEAEGIGRSEV